MKLSEISLEEKDSFFNLLSRYVSAIRSHQKAMDKKSILNVTITCELEEECWKNLLIIEKELKLILGMDAIDYDWHIENTSPFNRKSMEEELK